MTEPPLVEIEPGHQMRCHLPVDELARSEVPVPVPATTGPSTPAAT